MVIRGRPRQHAGEDGVRLADDLVSSLALAASGECPILIAPANEHAICGTPTPRRTT